MTVSLNLVKMPSDNRRIYHWANHQFMLLVIINSTIEIKNFRINITKIPTLNVTSGCRSETTKGNARLTIRIILR
jgi:hypothetical protein